MREARISRRTKRRYTFTTVADLMLFRGLHPGIVLSLNVGDVDIGAGWLRVVSKCAKERRGIKRSSRWPTIG